MKELISRAQFQLRQPSYPAKTPTDDYYFRLANRLANLIHDKKLLQQWPEALRNRVALGLTGYFQDILTDSGIWRSFIERHMAMYGKYLPFYAIGDEYIPNELNEEDVRFLVWYTLALNSDDQRVWNPDDIAIETAAKELHAILDEVYEDEDAPDPEEFFIWRGLEPGNLTEADEIYKFGTWLFMHCYLMTPAYAMTLSEHMADPALEGGKNTDKLREMLEKSVAEDPTGPLALFLHEWVYLILEGKMPPAAKRTLDNEAEVKEHPYYTKFIAATGGSPIKFFKTYEELNRFFGEALGWGNGENLPALKQSRDFVLLVNKHKGMLCAKDVARCISLPDNPCYDKEYAREHAMDLLTIRGLCPGDLLQYLFEHNALPDARFPGSDDTELVATNRDFIARCYLQLYYRGD